MILQGRHYAAELGRYALDRGNASQWQLTASPDEGHGTDVATGKP